MLARAVEPEAGEDGHTHETELPQLRRRADRPLLPSLRPEGPCPPHADRASWHDLAHGVLHFEGKIWRTLPLLAWRPGELTRRYVEGERARFVSPIALFLFSVFLMFAVFSLVGGPFTSAELEAAAEAEPRPSASSRATRTSACRDSGSQA